MNPSAEAEVEALDNDAALKLFRDLLGSDFDRWYCESVPAMGGRTPAQVVEDGDVEAFVALRKLFESGNYV